MRWSPERRAAALWSPPPHRDTSPAITRRIAIAQYSIAAVIAAVSLVMFFAAGPQWEITLREYLKQNLGPSWLLPLLYVLLALTLMLWAGMCYSNCGRGLFIVTVGIVLIVLASALISLRAIGNTEFVGVGAAVTLLGAAMVIVVESRCGSAPRKLLRLGRASARRTSAQQTNGKQV